MCRFIVRLRRRSGIVSILWLFPLIALFSCGCSSESKDQSLPTEELDGLDEMLGRSKEYDNRKGQYIDSLQLLLKKTPVSDTLSRVALLTHIGDQYRSFCSDSSIIFYLNAYDLEHASDPSDNQIELSLKILNSLAASGIFSEAQKVKAHIDSLTLTPAQELKFAQAGRQLYSYMKGYLDEENELAMSLTSEFDDYDAYLRENLPEDDPYRIFLVGEQYVRVGKNKEALKLLTKLLKTLKPEDNLYGMVTYRCAQASRNLGDDYNYGRYLALSAMSDVQGSVKETLSLPALSQWLYDKGDVDRAYRYANASLNDATASSSRMRTVAIANFMPIIDNSYRQKISASRDELMVYFLLVVVLLITSGSLLFIFLRNLRRSNRIRRQLHAQSKMQENYICHFLSLCASYADKLESTRRLVHRKITAGQTDELMKMMSSRSGDDQTDEFFKIFDETFLDLYPDFIDNFNTLLRPEEQIAYTHGSPLTTELRIYAFVRLGVQESVKIAQVLRCSVSTIYTYRNRMRGRAINRDTFEREVATLGEEK